MVRRVQGSQLFEKRPNGVYTKAAVRVPPGVELPPGQFVSGVPVKMSGAVAYISDLADLDLVVDGSDPVDVLDLA